MRPFNLSLILLLVANVVRASEFTIGPDGVNSKGLELTGSGIAIGQVELGRPGLPGKDMAKYVHPQVQPTDVYSGTSVDSANSVLVTDPGWGVHATQVAGVMIGKPTPLGSVKGVAPEAGLYAGGMNGVIGQGADISFALTANRIATLPAIVRAINVSAGRELQPVGEKTDGNQH